MPSQEAEEDFTPEVQAELELYDLMEELELSGGFKRPKMPGDPDRTMKMVNMLHALGEGLLHYQTKKREIPMELSREEIKSVNTSLGVIEGILNKKAETATGS